MPVDARSLLRAAVSKESSGDPGSNTTSTDAKRKTSNEEERPDEVKRKRLLNSERASKSSSLEQEEWRRFQEEVLLAPDLQASHVKNQPSVESNHRDATLQAPPVLNSNSQRHAGDTNTEEDFIGTLERQDSNLRYARVDLLERLQDEERVSEEGALRVKALRFRLASIKQASKSRSSK